VITIHNPPAFQKDGQTTCDGNIALCVASRGKKVKWRSLICNAKLRFLYKSTKIQLNDMLKIVFVVMC